MPTTRQSDFAIWFKARTGIELIAALDRVAIDETVWDWILDQYFLFIDSTGRTPMVSGSIPVLVTEVIPSKDIPNWFKKRSTKADEEGTT